MEKIRKKSMSEIFAGVIVFALGSCLLFIDQFSQKHFALVPIVGGLGAIFDGALGLAFGANKKHAIRKGDKLATIIFYILGGGGLVLGVIWFMFKTLPQLK